MPSFSAPELEPVGDALSEGLVVVDDVDVRDRRELLALGQFERLAQKQIRCRRSLVVVRGRKPGVVPLPGRVVDAGLSRRRPRRRVGQLHGRVRHAQHRERSTRGTVGERDDQLRAAGVERPEHREQRLVGSVRPAVRGALGRVPGACLRCGVVAGLVPDRVLARLEVVLRVEDVLDRLPHRDVCARPAPCSGRSDAIRYWGFPGPL